MREIPSLIIPNFTLFPTVNNDYYFWKYDKHKHFHWKISSELVRNIHFCSGSDIAVNRAD